MRFKIGRICLFFLTESTTALMIETLPGGCSFAGAEKAEAVMKVLQVLVLTGIATLWTPLRADVVHDSFPFDVIINAADCAQTGDLVIHTDIDTTTRTSVDGKGKVHFGMDFRAHGT